MHDPKRKSTLESTIVYRFGLFILDVTAGSLTRNGIRIRLQEQPFQLLALLLERDGAIVTREEIRQRLWESTTFVDFDKSLGVAVVKVREALGDSAANPRFLETVPRRGYRFIAPFTSARSESPERLLPPGEVAAVSHAVAAVADPAQLSPAPPRARKGRRVFWYIATGLGVMLALAFAVFRSRPVAKPMPEDRAPVAQTRLRRSVAVLGFRNVAAGPDQNWLSTAFAEMLNTELAASGDLRLVSGEDVASVKHDLGLPAEDTLGRTTLARLKSSLGADVVVVGAYTLISDGGKNRIRLDLRAQDTGLGETIFESSITGEEKDLFDLASQAGSRLRESLDPSQSLAPASAAAKVEGSTNQLALQFYSEGLVRLYNFDFVGARDLLQRAVTADPNFAEAHAALSSAFSSLGYEAQERDEARRAMQHATDLPQQTALFIKGRYLESIKDWPKAALTYEKLFQSFPDNLTYGLRLARVQLRLKQSDAEETLATLRALPTPLGDDPRIDLMEASVLVGTDLPKARAAAKRAIDKASGQHATLMVARGAGILCQTDTSFGAAADQFEADCSLARSSYLSAGDQNNAARTLNDFAGLYFARGDLLKAQQMWQEAIEVFRKVGDTQGVAAAANNLGEVMLTGGRLAEAQALLKQANSSYRQIGDLPGVALVLADLGEIALQRANLPEARKDYEAAVAAGLRAGDKSSTAYGVAGLGDVFLQQDQLAEARGQYGKALQLRTDIGEKQSILETTVALSRLAIEEGHAGDAEKEAAQCQSELHEEQFADDELDAGLVLVRAQLNQAKNADAQRSIDLLRPLAEKTQSRVLHLRFLLESAEMLRATHQEAASRSLLDEVAKEAEASGLATFAWEVDTLRAHAEADAGHAERAEQLSRLTEDKARHAGYRLLARHAQLSQARSNAPINPA